MSDVPPAPVESGSHAPSGFFARPAAQMNESMEESLATLRDLFTRYRHVVVAYSGGKDSTTLAVLVAQAILSKRVPAPATLTITYADTGLELLPLWLAAAEIRQSLFDRKEEFEALGTKLELRTVSAPMDERFLVYLCGRGVPPPNNRFRWCTEKTKILPMTRSLKDLERRARRERGRLLVLTGVRLGESAARDRRILVSCSADSAECGQGHLADAIEGKHSDTAAPLVAWRVCHVWRFLRDWAPSEEWGDWPTRLVADAYGEEAEQNATRTGCIGCPLVSRDRALETILRMPKWAYLAPLRKLRALFEELRDHHAGRLRKRGGERIGNGNLAANQQRVGPLCFDTRMDALERILSIQREINESARLLRRPPIDLIDPEEEARIRRLVDLRVWPEGWSGDEPRGDELLDLVNRHGQVQPLLPGVKSDEAPQPVAWWMERGPRWTLASAAERAWGAHLFGGEPFKAKSVERRILEIAAELDQLAPGKIPAALRLVAASRAAPPDPMAPVRLFAIPKTPGGYDNAFELRAGPKDSHALRLEDMSVHAARIAEASKIAGVSGLSDLPPDELSAAFALHFPDGLPVRVKRDLLVPVL